MLRHIHDLDTTIPKSQPGAISENDKWWAERQEALERVGYMLRSRYRAGWKPSWEGTKRFIFDCEDALSVNVSNISRFYLAARIYDFSSV